MEVYRLFCADELMPGGVAEIDVLGFCKESIIKWWKETGYHKVLPLKSIQCIG